ncbi:hypothetical protein [Trabulsiella odontotermitis]|uniref:Uncharacterized protein n=1 Tax=Trabulsiella odontotermitis TaxID=379893 RepID=A0A0L0GIW9_9ENTR|nr:hypothetical protein [Trabulsiella odontotermitis]KNC88273.1 hypothetical protein GM31_11165 [Trabulsiella odontotermitis]
MAKQHLDLAVRYANSSCLIQLSLKASEAAKVLREDIEYIQEMMLDSGVGVAQDLTALLDAVVGLKKTEKLLEICEKASRKVSREVRDQLSDVE